ncbi:assimilatory nitrate reductase NasA [Halobaculum sp. D14]|uniref:assimilatory nitrate reductase NasA n=1 Tax=Halobaculum sp. D14 TaxID=3421642 RepID=UPI003EB935A8
MTAPVPTTCMRCAVGCGHVQRGVDSGYGVAAVRGDVSHPVNNGLACSRGIRESADPDGEWLTQPLVREDGELLATTWDVALARVAEEFRARLERDPDSVAVLGSGQQTNEAAYALGKLARGGFGTRYYDANTTLCMASAVAAYYDAFGSDAPPCTYDDIPEAETHLVWGANPAVAHPVMFRWIAESAEADGSRLVVVDPVESETAERADAHVAPDPGGDLALARAVLARLVDRGDVDREFVAAATTGFAALTERLPAAESAARDAGVSMSVVDGLVDALCDDTLLYWGMGVNQSVRGTATAGALVDLCLASGNLGGGSGPFSLTGQANSMGTRVCSAKGTWPGHRSFIDPDERRVVADAWGVPVNRLPDDAGPGPVGLVDAVDDGPVSAVWAVATNPVAGLPDATAAKRRLDDAFLVVQDGFRTETVEHADVVLPAATWGESEGTAINMERTVSRVRAATDLPSGVRTDLDVITTVAARVVPGLFETTTPAGLFDELAALTAGTPADLSGISYDRLDDETAVRWPAPDAASSTAYRYVDGDGWSFETPSGAARFSAGDGDPLPEPTDDRYPLTLTTARESDGYNTGIRSRTRDGGDDAGGSADADGSADREDGPAVDPDVETHGVDAPDSVSGTDAGSDHGPVRCRVHPETAERLSDEDGTAVVESRRAAVPVRVEADDAIPEGMVWLPIHHPRTNELTVPETDPRSDEPNYKQCAVRLSATPTESELVTKRGANADD